MPNGPSLALRARMGRVRKPNEYRSRRLMRNERLRLAFPRGVGLPYDSESEGRVKAIEPGGDRCVAAVDGL